MSSILTSIFSSTLGLLWNKACDATAESLQDGDVTDAKICEIVVRELNDIKTKPNVLSRKYLLRSYIFLKEGVLLLSDSLDKSKDEQKAAVNEDKHENVTSSRIPSGVDILNDALQLSQAMVKLRIESNQFEAAKDQFKDARMEASRAFCNEALSIQDRIFAAKLRVISEMLECIDNPNTAVISCLLFLEQLHYLSDVREIFSVYFRGGVKSIFGKAEPVENVKSIMMINYVLYQLANNLSSIYLGEFNWPTIQLSDRTFNPILHWNELSMRESWGDELQQPPNRVGVDEEINPYISAMNSRGQIVLVDNFGVSIISRTGKSTSVLPLPVLQSEDEDGNEMKHDIVGIDVDKENNVYLIVLRCKENGYGNLEVLHVVLYVFDKHCNDVKHKTLLNFLPKLEYWYVPLAMNKNKNIVMRGDDTVYVCDVTGQLKCVFKPKYDPLSICVSKNDKIITASRVDNTVEIYTEEGNLETTMKLPAGHEVRSVAFHFGISKIIVLSEDRENGVYHLHFYSETSNEHTSTCLDERSYFNTSLTFAYNITSHPGGPAAVVTSKAILYL